MYLQGVFYYILTIFFFSMMGIGIKYLPGIPFYEIVFARSIISFSFCYFIIRKKDLNLFGKKENRKLLIARGSAGTIGLCCFFYSIQKLNLSYAVTVQQLSPVFILILSFFIFKRKIYLLQWVSAALAFFGVYLIYKYNINEVDRFVTIGILGAFVSAIAYQIIYLIKDKENSNVIIVYFPMISIPIAGVMLLYDYVIPNLNQFLLLCWVGLMAHFAQLCLTKAYQKVEPGKLGIYSNLNIVSASIVGYLLFNEHLNKEQWFGVYIILFAIILSGLSNYFKK